jgi:hypothetical protein
MMLTGYHLATARRLWFIPDFVVWGLPSLGDLEFLTHETVDGTASVHFGSASIGDSQQVVHYHDLTDHRGNALPQTLNQARVLPRARGARQAYVVAEESGDSFRIARPSDSDGPVTTDLLILELGD